MNISHIEEPILRAIRGFISQNYGWENYLSEKKKSNEDNMKQGVSLIVNDTEGRTIATLISSIADRDSPPLPEANPSCSLYLLRAAIGLSAGSTEELLQKEKDVKKVYYIDYVTVHPDYRRKGIASTLISFSQEVKLGFTPLKRSSEIFPKFQHGAVENPFKY